MNKWVLLEHKVYSANAFNIHYDFLVENGIDCLTWKFLKLPLLNKASIEISKQPNHRLVWLSRIEYELSDNRGFVRRIDHGYYICIIIFCFSHNPYRFWISCSSYRWSWKFAIHCIKICS